MTSPRWAQLWALIGGLSLEIMLCGTGHAESLHVVCSDGCIDYQRCTADLAAVLQEREDLDALQHRVNNFYRTAVVDDDGECVNCLVSSNGSGWVPTKTRLGTDYVPSPEGFLIYDPDRSYDPLTEKVVKKTEEELYQEQKAKILEQLTELDRDRSRKKEQAKRDAQYERMKEQLEEAKGHLIVSWETVKRRCVR